VKTQYEVFWVVVVYQRVGGLCCLTLNRNGKTLALRHIPHGTAFRFSSRVRAFLDREFPDRWLGRVGPILWLPRSSDLSSGHL
jgi:hypothetical protein